MKKKKKDKSKTSQMNKSPIIKKGSEEAFKPLYDHVIMTKYH